jgi:hypothetical protein
VTLILSGSNGLSDVDGSAAAPAIRGTDTNTGIFFPAADTISFVEGGTEALRINSSAQLVTTAGTVALPAITATGDTDTGVFFPAADTVAIVTAGTEDFRIGPVGQFGVQGANYGTAGQVLTSGGAAAPPSWTSAGGSVNVQTFTSSGTWTKPAYAAGSRVLIQCWGGGGSGGFGATNSGGGGGGYNERWLSLSQMGATETITIGAGGAAKTTSGAGNVGGATTVGSLAAAYGGGGGGSGGAGQAGVGGGGGGQLTAGSTGNASGVNTEPGAPLIMTRYDVGSDLTFYQGSAKNTNNFSTSYFDANMHGGGGGGNQSQYTSGNSIWGGGGGGASAVNTAGGTSKYAGNGGAGGATGTAGTQPSGGGGGSTGNPSGAGAAGQVIITVFPA